MRGLYGSRSCQRFFWWSYGRTPHIRFNPSLQCDRCFCRLISRCHVNCEYVHCLFCAYCHCRCRLYDNCWSYLYSAFSMEKERNLSRAYDTLIEELKIENEKAEKIMKEIMKNP